jgi:hypothetical protein
MRQSLAGVFGWGVLSGMLVTTKLPGEDPKTPDRSLLRYLCGEELADLAALGDRDRWLAQRLRLAAALPVWQERLAGGTVF